MMEDLPVLINLKAGKMHRSKICTRLLFALILLPVTASAQQPNTTFQSDSEYAFMPIKDLVPDTTDKTNSLGIDLMLGNNGFGLGVFYMRAIDGTLSWTLSLSAAEAKAPNEVETYYYDIYGNIYQTVLGKVNELFDIPVMAGLQYRLFKDQIVNTFQPYINAGFGPNMVLAFPYNTPLSTSFSKAHSYFGVGAYVGAGTYISLTPNTLMGINIQYYILP
ncbi:MAG: outer membrane beta-barrel protein, partial [Candidatus Kryptoniota bacterium]